MSPTIYLTVILSVIISLLALAHALDGAMGGRWKGDKYNTIDYSEYIGPGVIAGFIIGIIAWVSIGLGCQPDGTEYEKPKRQLVALKDGESMSGSFFLGSGSFSGEMKYYGYENLGNERYKMVKFPNSSIIIEDVKEGEKSYFVEIRQKADVENYKYKKWMIGPFEMDMFIRWEIHIPKGSILRGNYELDLN